MLTIGSLKATMRVMLPPAAPATAALRVARRGWRLQYLDSAQSLALGERALALAANDDPLGSGWALLVQGFYRMRHAAPATAMEVLIAAQHRLATAGDAGAVILADVGMARCQLNSGRHRAALARLLPYRAEGLRLLRDQERAMLLNGIAGCYSALGDSAQAFAYMYEALRDTRPARSYGIDVVLYCNLAHELYELGDYEESLRYLEEGVQRCAQLNNRRLLSTLLVNRIVCLTDLNRAADALPDIERLLQQPSGEATARSSATGYESMAVAAYRAGRTVLADTLAERACELLADEPAPDVQLELTVARAEQARARGDLTGAAAIMRQALPLPSDSGLTLRGRCLFVQTYADLLQAQGDSAGALAQMRLWQQLHLERTLRASRARAQAASLQTELMRLQRERDAIEARSRSAERAREQLAAINQQLSQRVSEVQALKAALEQQTVRDFLTGLFNRRHLNDVLPSMLALAQRNGEPLAVSIIDLDHFKLINDRHGHVAGDRVLQGFGALVLQSLRRSDVACRYGGEEFCILMPRTHAHAARRKIDALRRQWRASSFEVDGGVVSGSSFSAGVADSFTAEGSAERLLKAADDCALDAKRRGRNQSVVFAAARRIGAAADRAPSPAFAAKTHTPDLPRSA